MELYHVFIIGILVCSFIAFVFFRGYTKLKRKIRTMEYTDTGVIVGRKIYNKRRSSRKNPLYWPVVTFTVNHKQYKITGHRGQTPALRKGKKVGIYYNPANPEEIIIDTFVQRGGLNIVTAYVFLFVAAALANMLYIGLNR